MAETVDKAIRAAQERLHRAIGQWARVAHRRVAERAAKERVAILRVLRDPPRITHPPFRVEFFESSESRE